MRIELSPGVVLTAPAGATHGEGQGFDSTVGTIGGSGFECSYDVGRYSDDLASMEAASVEERTISGRPARIVTGPGGRLGLHVPEIARTSLGPTRLTLVCDTSTAAGREDVRAIFDSLEVE